MATVKTSELSGTALDYAVALSLGKRPSMFIYERSRELAKEHRYSSDWSQAGPIIERELISVDSTYTGQWSADGVDAKGFAVIRVGPTPLVAAMRCFVACKLGHSVDIPEALTR